MSGYTKIEPIIWEWDITVTSGLRGSCAVDIRYPGYKKEHKVHEDKPEIARYLAIREAIDEIWCEICNLRRLTKEDNQYLDHRVELIVRLSYSLGVTAIRLREYGHHYWVNVGTTTISADKLHDVMRGFLQHESSTYVVDRAWLAGFNCCPSFTYRIIDSNHATCDA